MIRSYPCSVCGEDTKLTCGSMVAGKEYIGLRCLSCGHSFDVPHKQYDDVTNPHRHKRFAGSILRDLSPIERGEVLKELEAGKYGKTKV